MDHSENVDSNLGGVAIIGMVGRFPGASDLETYWRNIRQGIETVTHFQDERLVKAGVPQGLLSHPAYVKARGVVDDIDMFDPSFFGYSARDAVVMDPQQRLFLQCCWEGLETAGYDPRAYQGLIGVYGGATASSYQGMVWANLDALKVDGMSAAIGNELPFLTTRVSYKLDLKGPSCPVQTACSTSLVAVHLACQGLLNAECDMALAGGVSLRVPQEAGYVYQEEGILSPDGRCRPFDATANGTLFSNGLGVVVLKRLEDALADGDTVYAVIRGSAINNDGARKASFTAPGVVGQSQVIADALASAQVEPETISYIETHGTATALGDSIEIQALTKAFATSQRGYCGLGSVKANIGHLDAAAGVAGLIKTALALHHKQMPPMVHFTRPNPDINFGATPFYVNDSLKEWKPVGGSVRRAGVSAFGFGGTNAHVVLEEAPKVDPAGPSRKWQLLTLSAQTHDVLETATTNLGAYLSSHANVNLADAAYTLKVGRRAFRHRRAVACSSLGDAARLLESRDMRATFNGSHDGVDRPVVFLFPGQGAQHVNMGRELYEQEPSFRDVVDACAETLVSVLGFDLREVLYPADATDAHSERLTRTSVAQPALFVIEYALARLWISWGVRPASFLGHSIGEWTAACLAGVIDLDAALEIVALRGRLMEQMPPGVMAAVPMSEADLRRVMTDRLWLAAVNHPQLCVVSGAAADIDTLEQRLRSEGVEIQRIRTSHAFHSGLMDAAVAPFVEAVSKVGLREPSTPFISNVTGGWITSAEATDPAYWGRQIRQPVRFAAGAATVLKDDTSIFLEVGPGNTLSSLVRRQAGARSSQAAISSLRHARDQQTSDMASVMGALGQLWVSGAGVDWKEFHSGEDRRRIALPPYPFERHRYWVDPPPAVDSARQSRRKIAGRNPNVDEWFYVPGWKRVPIAVSADSIKANPRSWLLLGDEEQLAERLALRLVEGNHTVTRVVRGERYQRLGPGRYMVNPTSRADYDVLMKELIDHGQSPAVAIHLWSLGRVTDESAVTSYRQERTAGFDGLLAFAQAVGDLALPAPMRIAVVTNDAQDVTGREPLAPARAMTLALNRVIPQEYPSLSCRSIDLSWDGTNGVAEIAGTWLDCLLQDVGSAHGDPVVSYRDGHRWAQVFSPLTLPRATGVPGRLRANGVYLITGGLGEIGLHMAQALVESVKARVVLTGRSGVPAREEWDAHISARGSEDLISQRILRLRKIESLGGRVIVIKADASDRAAMEGAFAFAEKHFGPINGVIHAAGLILGDAFRPIAETDPDSCRRQFEPKVDGLVVLDEVIAGRDLDFCMLVSSLSSMLGGLRYGAYSAANAFMDVMAARRNRAGRYPWLAVNWDAWLRAEDEARLKSGKTLPDGFVLSGAEGVDAFRRLLSADAGVQVVVSTGDLQERLHQWVGEGLKRMETVQTVKHPRPVLQTEFVAPRTPLETTIATVWQELLGIEKVGVMDNFFELGGDSFLGIQLIAKLKAQLGVKLSAVALYEGPRVSLLAQLIGDQTEGAAVAAAIDHSRSRGEKRRERKLQNEMATGNVRG
jgi:acyl transferase domain-containing protein